MFLKSKEGSPFTQVRWTETSRRNSRPSFAYGDSVLLRLIPHFILILDYQDVPIDYELWVFIITVTWPMIKIQNYTHHTFTNLGQPRLQDLVILELITYWKYVGWLENHHSKLILGIWQYCYQIRLLLLLNCHLVQCFTESRYAFLLWWGSVPAGSLASFSPAQLLCGRSCLNVF